MMDAAQKAQFRAALLAETDPTLVGLRNQGAAAYSAIKDWYNAASTTDVWKPRIDVAQLLNAVVWSEFVNAGISNQNAWFALTQGGYVDATEPRIRAGFTSVFGGGAQSVTNLSAIAQRKATRFEAVFTTSGVCALFGQAVTYGEVETAMTGG